MHSVLPDRLLNSVPLPIIAADDRGNILSMNPAAEVLLGDSASVHDLFPNWERLLTGLRATPAQCRYEITLGENRTFEANFGELPGYGWTIALYDISERRAADQRKNYVLGEVTHDLKNPLAAISSFADVVRASGDLNDSQVKFLERIKGTASRMAEQVHQLLDITWIEEGMQLSLTEIDLLALVKQTVEEVEPRAATRNNVIALDTPPFVPLISADQVRLMQVFTNLLTNAIKYSHANTTISVQIRVESEEIAVLVSDKGPGIAPEHLDRLFEQFYRINSPQTRGIEGTGLGLYITQSIIEQHGGRITVESVQGVGSTFTVHLPRSV
jgi:two-component system phosphate regulon sensor histidine kinase PhoR